MDGVYVELGVRKPRECAIAGLLDETDEAAHSINWCSDGVSGREQFRHENSDLEADAVFTSEGDTIYEVTRPERCVCKSIEDLDHPIHEVRVEGDELFVSLYLDSVEELETIVDRVNPISDAVRVCHLSHESPDDGDGDVVPIDLGCLTDRQREVLATAHEMGYFERPRESSAEEAATELGISPSTFAEHKAVALSKLLDQLPESRYKKHHATEGRD